MSSCPFSGLIQSSKKNDTSKCPFNFGKTNIESSSPSNSNNSSFEERKLVEESFTSNTKSSESTASNEYTLSEKESNGLNLKTQEGLLLNDESLPSKSEQEKKNVKEETKAKCPYGFDSFSFKIGPFSCVICKALLFESCRVIPCKHVFCRGCVSRYNDCPLCGVDVERLEVDNEMQSLVDKFIQGHGRIQRPKMNSESEEMDEKMKSLSIQDYGYDVSPSSSSSLERGSFLLQQAMRAFSAGNISSAQNRLQICLDDTKAELAQQGSTSAISCQLGAILGSLGDCCRLIGETEEAMKHYEDSVNHLTSVQPADLQVIHALSVSLNKLGDLKYYDGELNEARSFYERALQIRQKALNEEENKKEISLNLDVCVSLAKVADVDRAMGNDVACCQGFENALKMAKDIKIPAEMNALASRRESMMAFIKSQMEI